MSHDSGHEPLPMPMASPNSSSIPSRQTPRTARFAEATSVHSPGEPTSEAPNPFDTPPISPVDPHPKDVGFGYINPKHDTKSGSDPASAVENPIKRALKRHDVAPQRTNTGATIRSPTFDEEQELEKHETLTTKEQARDLNVKKRVRLAKIFLRITNFSCSLIVLSMLAATFQIFNASKSLPPRNNFPAWADGTETWPQITVLVISCLSLAASIIILAANFRFGHRRAEKLGSYYNFMTVGFFSFSIVMWGLGAGVLQSSKNKAAGNDIWSWSCKNNDRAEYFGNVDYQLVCRLQNWSLICCLIEVVVETFTITIYAIIFYRFHSKHRLAKTMARRDAARSEFYNAKMRTQSATDSPTPADGPLSADPGGYNSLYSPHNAQGGASSTARYEEAAYGIPAEDTAYEHHQQEEPHQHNQTSRYAPLTPPQSAYSFSRPFGLWAAPAAREPTMHARAPSAPDEPVYDDVPIPGAYAKPSVESRLLDASP